LEDQSRLTSAGEEHWHTLKDFEPQRIRTALIRIIADLQFEKLASA